MTNTDASTLLALLCAMAAYNDKGFEWSRHSPARVAQQRQVFEAELAAFIERVRPANIPAPVLAALGAEDLSADPTGDHVQTVKRLLEIAAE